MIINLLIGLPSERPGGLILTIIYAILTGLIALFIGFVYAIVA